MWFDPADSLERALIRQQVVHALEHRPDGSLDPYLGPSGLVGPILHDDACCVPSRLNIKGLTWEFVRKIDSEFRRLIIIIRNTFSFYQIVVNFLSNSFWSLQESMPTSGPAMLMRFLSAVKRCHPRILYRRGIPFCMTNLEEFSNFFFFSSSSLI